MGVMCMSIGEDRPPLLARVDVYLKKHRLSERRFSLLASGQPNLLHRVRQRQNPRKGTIELIEAMMAGPPVTLTPKVYKVRRYSLQVSETIRADLAERSRRATCPVEQAATFLRRDGWMVCRASVKVADATGFLVGRLSLTDEEMMAMARKKGWEG